MLLRHSGLCTVDAVADQLAEERIADLAAHVKVRFLILVHQEYMSAALACADVDVLALLDVSLCAEDEHTAVAPGAKTVRREPVNAEVTGRTVVRYEVAVAEVIQSRVVRMVVVGDLAVDDRGILRACVEQELLNLMAADVAQDSAVLLLRRTMPDGSIPRRCGAGPCPASG